MGEMTPLRAAARLQPAPLMALIADFSAEAEVNPAETPDAMCDERDEAVMTPLFAAEPDPGPSLDTQLAEARETGRAEGQAAERARCDAVLAAERDAFEARLADERRRWAQDEAEGLREAMAAAFAALEERMAHQIAAVLETYLSVQARRNAVKVFSAAVADMVHGETAVRVSGPADLIEAMRAIWPAEAGGVIFAEGDGPELVACLDDSIIETCLGAHIEAIRRTRK